MTIDEERRLLSELRDRIIAGEEGAWDELLDLGEIRNRILAAVKGSGYEDILTDLYLALWDNGSFDDFRKIDLRSINELRAYLNQRVKWLQSDRIKKSKKISDKECSLLTDENSSYGETAIDPEKAFISAETRRVVQALKAQLSESCQIILMQADMKLSAETLRLKYDAVRRQKSRNIGHLRELVEENGIQL